MQPYSEVNQQQGGIEIREGRGAPCPAEGREFAASLFVPTSRLILLATGRAEAPTEEAAGRLRIEGDRARAEALMAVLFRPI